LLRTFEKGSRCAIGISGLVTIIDPNYYIKPFLSTINNLCILAALKNVLFVKIADQPFALKWLKSYWNWIIAFIIVVLGWMCVVNNDTRLCIDAPITVLTILFFGSILWETASKQDFSKRAYLIAILVSILLVCIQAIQQCHLLHKINESFLVKYFNLHQLKLGANWKIILIFIPLIYKTIMWLQFILLLSWYKIRRTSLSRIRKLRIELEEVGNVHFEMPFQKGRGSVNDFLGFSSIDLEDGESKKFQDWKVVYSASIKQNVKKLFVEPIKITFQLALQKVGIHQNEATELQAVEVQFSNLLKSKLEELFDHHDELNGRPVNRFWQRSQIDTRALLKNFQDHRLDYQIVYFMIYAALTNDISTEDDPYPLERIAATENHRNPNLRSIKFDIEIYWRLLQAIYDLFKSFAVTADHQGGFVQTIRVDLNQHLMEIIVHNFDVAGLKARIKGINQRQHERNNTHTVSTNILLLSELMKQQIVADSGNLNNGLLETKQRFIIKSLSDTQLGITFNFKTY
jgi:hypothetical protein